ncbi:tankyrase-2-like [Chenopodium quinoa]|uniref:tankyrase-2-like n=1 Tax=Chenopodium quinoa TaxID=63459 RepID=UPI000B775AB7|nr:tankyrase-2-like [Chenopodium quinoa]
MAVPGRRNGMLEDEDNDVEEGLFEEDALVVDAQFDDIPPHLRDLAAASQSGDLPALRLALDNLDGNINEPVEDGDTALHLTCLYGHLPCVQLLLERGAAVEAKDEDGALPLHDACAGGYTEIVQLLISRASDPECLRRMLETVDVEGDTPLHHAARGEHLDVIRLLLAHGASPTKKNIYDKIPAELAEPDTETKRFLEAAANTIAF